MEIFLPSTVTTSNLESDRRCRKAFPTAYFEAAAPATANAAIIG